MELGYTGPMQHIHSFLSAKRFYREGLLIGLICVFFFGFMLGSRPLSAPDEGRYTEIPREMVASGDYITPRLNGVKYFEKPPLMYWAGAISIKVFGVNEWALRFWPAFLGLLTVMATYAMGCILQSARAGRFCAIMMATGVLFYAHTRLLILDMAVATWMTLALYSFFLSTRLFLSEKKRFLYLMGFFVFSALAVLSKGLIGLVLPGGIITLWSFVTKNFKSLARAFHPLGIMVFLGITLPWHIMASLKNPEFFDFYIIHEHFTRYLKTVHNRYQPWWFFIPILWIGLFPWTFIIFSRVSSYMTSLKEGEMPLFFGLWALIVFVFFSLSHSKLIPYILPIIPPLVLLTGLKLDEEDLRSSTPWPAYLSALCAGVFMIALPLASHHYEILKSSEIYGYLGVLMALLGAIVFVSLRNPEHVPLKAYGILGALFLMVLNGAWPYLDTRSVKTLAQQIKVTHNPGDPIVAFARYYQDLPPYVNQTIKVVDWQGELAFGMAQEDTSQWMMTRDAFFSWYDPHKTVYIVTRKEFLPQLREGLRSSLKVIGETEHDVLVVPQ
jgi:4-amino-4-deoxy-L-arabinose transferase-like glycosyltransferase